ncbi:MAG: barstar family protein [Planctomycetaceae bacterium]
MSKRQEFVEIDLQSINSSEDLHRMLAVSLGFPDFYGRNWNAFWDAITGLVEMPRRIRLKGWFNLLRTLPNDAASMRECLEDMAKEFPDWAPDIEYS